MRSNIVLEKEALAELTPDDLIRLGGGSPAPDDTGTLVCVVVHGDINIAPYSLSICN